MNKDTLKKWRTLHELGWDIKIQPAAQQMWMIRIGKSFGPCAIGDYESATPARVDDDLDAAFTVLYDSAMAAEARWESKTLRPRSIVDE